MATNTTAIAGEKVFTIGVQVTSADLVAPGVGPHPVLSIHNLTIPSIAGIGPIQAAGSNNKADLQTVQSVVLDPQFPGPYTGGAATQFYKDSWWYASKGANGDVPGILDGQIDGDGNTGRITNNLFVGALGYLWQPTGNGIQGGITSTPTMTFSGTYGPDGANALDLAPLASQFVGGVLTVPLAQVVVANTIRLPLDYSAGQSLSIGNRDYSWNGVAPDIATCPELIDFQSNVVWAGLCPEPSSYALALSAGLGLAFWWSCYRRALGRARRRGTITLVGLALVLACQQQAQAVSLMVMATNTTALAGQKLYTIGVRLRSEDLTALIVAHRSRRRAL